MNSNLTREELLEVQFAMLQEIHNFCMSNQLTYYLAYGTLIGAVRHHGFIPWDDDVDIMMPVNDYEKLRQLYKSDRYLVTDCFHDKRHQLCFPRIYDSFTCRDNNKHSLGVYIDIYLIHGAPDCDIERAKHALKIMKLKKQCDFMSKWRGRIARHCFPSLWDHYRSSLTTWYCKRMYKILQDYKSVNGKMVFAYSGEGLRDYFWRDFFDETILLPFNGCEFCVPKKYHEVLTTIYGNYMILPPEEERHPYHGSSCYFWKD